MNRIADIGTYCACLLPRKMLEDAPVNPNGPGNGGNSGGSGFQVFPANARAMNRGGETPMTTSAPKFSGSGARLGNSSADTSSERSGFMSKIISRGNSSSSKAGGGGSVAEKREKARLAALARFEQSSTGDDANGLKSS